MKNNNSTLVRTRLQNTNLEKIKDFSLSWLLNELLNNLDTKSIKKLKEKEVQWKLQKKVKNMYIE